jgi:GST-like protein
MEIACKRFRERLIIAWAAGGPAESLRLSRRTFQAPLTQRPRRMTESAAILIWLADRYPDAGLAPLATDERRPAFLRWMAYVSSAIYGLAWVRGDPMRLVSDERQVEVVLDRIAHRRANCWRWMDEQIQPCRFLLGDNLGVLDLYVATVSRWSPRRQSFYREAPKMAEVVRRVDADPRLAEFWQARFPFYEGWEG